MIEGARLQDQALLVLLSLGEKGSTSSSLEDLANAVVSLSRAFEILVCANLLADFFALLYRRCQPEIFDCSPESQPIRGAWQ
jgi:hypothetical protein